MNNFYTQWQFTHLWYCCYMSDTMIINVGNKGRIVVPATARNRHSWHQDTELIVVDKPEGVLLMTREEALRSLRNQLGDSHLFDALTAERRAQAASEDSSAT